jgi:hypothetical protein
MASSFTQIALAVTGLAIIFLGFVPGNGLRGGIIAVGTVIAAAFVLHFVAPEKLQLRQAGAIVARVSR